ncbi:MAG TPA: MEDS domain-containing protein, partial [Solirubrobacterales bacterium]
DFVDEHRGRPVRGIGEPVWAARSPAALEECHRHEALLNLAFAEDPDFQLLCPYDAGSLPSHVLERIVLSHRHPDQTGGSHERVESDHRFDAFAGQLPPPAVTPDTLDFGLAERAGLDATAVADLITATSELAANSIMHGGGSGTLRLWQDGATLLVEVEDRGLIEEPLVGRLRPDITQEGGRGLWLANQLCDLVQIRSGVQGTVVRLHMQVGESAPVLERLGAGIGRWAEHSSA